MKSRNLQFSCPECYSPLVQSENSLQCNICKKEYEIENGIAVFLSDGERNNALFYDEWHKCPHKAYNLKNIGKAIKSSDFIARYSWVFRYLLYTQYKRERFFRRVVKILKRHYSHPLILDMGCGGGNTDIAQAGDVCGIDYSITSLKGSFAHKNYALLTNGSVLSLPFESEMFDCIISSDLIGHIRHQDKEQLFREMSRVLKRDGFCAHLLETDSDNFIKKFAKKHPDLYNRYFIEGIGGHFGLEMPEVVLERFRNAGLRPVSVRKYYTYVWDIESFIALFDNEYLEKSVMLRTVVNFYTLLCKNFKVKVAATAALGALSFLIDTVSPLSKAEGLMVICRKV